MVRGARKTPPPLAGGGRGEGSARSILNNARELRRTATPAVRKLWQAIRNHQLSGLKFRRQMPLGSYIADFYCASARLVVAVDGISHLDSRTNATRDEWMKVQGVRVLRVANVDVLSNLEGVLLAIQAAAGLTPPPHPLPQGEGEVSTARDPSLSHV